MANGIYRCNLTFLALVREQMNMNEGVPENMIKQ